MSSKSTSGKLNWLVKIGVPLNGLIIFLIPLQGASTNLTTIFVTVSLIMWVGSLAGMLLIRFTEKTKIGTILVIVGSVFFVPLGLIAIIGAVKVQDEFKRREFAQSV